MVLKVNFLIIIVWHSPPITSACSCCRWKQTSLWMSYRADRHPLPARSYAMIKPPKNLLLSILLNYTTFSTELFNCIPHCWLITWRLMRGAWCVKWVYDCVSAPPEHQKQTSAKAHRGPQKNTTNTWNIINEITSNDH